jgi:hypoxanthine-DNA glycosylase
MLETHPFGSFVPPKAQYVLLGSFTTKEAYDTGKIYPWFYANSRNQFWPILESVYGRSLRARAEMENLFVDLHMALADIIYQCERKKNSNLDMNLVNIVYAVEDITQILEKNQISKIFFTSRFVETKFKRLFPQYSHITQITLPSPSPRYAKLTLSQKITQYRNLLPVLK